MSWGQFRNTYQLSFAGTQANSQSIEVESVATSPHAGSPSNNVLTDLGPKSTDSGPIRPDRIGGVGSGIGHTRFSTDSAPIRPTAELYAFYRTSR